MQGWKQDQCQCIVNAESSGMANAANWDAPDATYDVGLWQINTVNWASCNGGSMPCDQTANRNCAIDVWRYGGNSFKLWSTCSKCGACNGDDDAVNAEWDGSWPEGYDATRPFPAWALNATEARMPRKQIVLTEQ